ncbi:MAG: hypothetical protein ACYCS0_00965 [bacterium]
MKKIILLIFFILSATTVYAYQNINPTSINPKIVALAKKYAMSGKLTIHTININNSKRLLLMFIPYKGGHIISTIKVKITPYCQKNITHIQHKKSIFYQVVARYAISKSINFYFTKHGFFATENRLKLFKRPWSCIKAMAFNEKSNTGECVVKKEKYIYESNLHSKNMPGYSFIVMYKKGVSGKRPRLEMMEIITLTGLYPLNGNTRIKDYNTCPKNLKIMGKTNKIF